MPSDPSMVSTFERDNEITLPEDYRQFLKNHDAAGRGPLQLVSKYGPRDEAFYVVGTVLPLADQKEVGFENLQTFMDTYRKRKRIPREMVPIASDPFGNLFLLKIEGGEIGKVSFWDHERELDNASDRQYTNLRPIADSFSEFLGLLEPYDDAK